MKHRTDRILLAAFLLTAVLYALFLLGSPILCIIPLWPERFVLCSSLPGLLALGFHALPCFCIQLLLCRTVKSLGVRLIPVYLLLGFAAWFAVGLSAATGWDTIGWGFMLALCAAPAAGYALAWMVYGAQRLDQYINE